MAKSNEEKSKQLGMNYSTAYHRLRKDLLFRLVQETGRDFCHQCKKKIATVEELSIEHIEAWMYKSNSVELFFDVDNISFSHLKCNSLSARCSFKTNNKHGYKGVSFNKRRKTNPFEACIWNQSRKQNDFLGVFVTAEEAAKKYDEQAIERFGDRAVTNKMLGLL